MVLRGPSGAGKSTVAKALAEELKALGQRSAYFDMDYFRQIIPGRGLKGSESATVCSAMLLGALRGALECGHHVILEGIFSIRSFKSFLLDLQLEYSSRIYFFYINVNFEETLRRHQTRAKAAEFGSEDMADWYPAASPLSSDGGFGVCVETEIEQSSEIASSVLTILRTAGLF